MRLWLALLLLALNIGRAEADEVSRIRAHLQAARILLDARDVSLLTPSQREHRSRAIAVLDGYIARGVFPRRTSDPYGAMRPRFIDDRGVHCAVGEMIAETGSPQLALEINSRYEYAFVRDIDFPALLAWADEYGFTVDELAAIQPSYADPNGSPAWEDFEIELHVSELALACLKDKLPPREVELTVTGGAGKIQLTTSATDDFSRCFAARAERFVRQERFPASTKVAIPSMDALMQLQLMPPLCASRQGAVPKEATIDFATGSVVTRPENKEVEACLADVLEHKVEPFRRRLAVQAHIELPAMITNWGVHETLIGNAPRIAWQCVSFGDPEEIKLVVTAHEGDNEFAVATPGANARYSACVRAKLTDALRGLLKTQSVHRIDSDVDATLTFKLVHQSHP